MVFSSEVFLFLFLPVVYLLYLAARNILLIVVSLVFYAYKWYGYRFSKD